MEVGLVCFGDALSRSTDTRSPLSPRAAALRAVGRAVTAGVEVGGGILGGLERSVGMRREEKCREKGAKCAGGLQDRVTQAEEKREEQQQVQQSLPARRQTCRRAWEKNGGWWFEIKKCSRRWEIGRGTR